MVLVEYVYTEKFPEFSEFIKNNKEKLSLHGDPCKLGSIGARKFYGNKFNEDTCNAGLFFASKIIGNPYNHDTRARCLYLYYWLYKQLKANNTRDHTKSVYLEFFNNIGGNSKYVCKDYWYISILDEELNLLDDLHEMNSKLYDIKKNKYLSEENKCHRFNECSDMYKHYSKECTPYNYSSFCDALENIKNLYNDLQNSNGCVHAKCKKLPCYNTENIESPSPKTNKSKFSIILTILILIIPLLLFVIYKFTPYNSSLHCGIKKIVNKCRDLNEVWNKSQNSEISDSAYWNNSYDVLYSSL
ncbi:variable surface protein [Plasmodium gonderi]|uniref:Variable surface protein n=1 Tax=Plasmodium gonderi TaxID=77519 RepID=A0A1Y1JP27_PLAGO|nr:variable surface protein [Plasmodium gonderi]GAW84229.1 variable surface protein [Plasmodium gonderi]